MEVGAFQRTRKVRPDDLLFALIAGCCNGPTRSIAGARRAWECIAGDTISRAAFDEQLDDPRRVRWIWKLLARLMECSNREARRQWPAPLRALSDVVIDDGTRMRVRPALRALRSTNDAQSGIKLMGSLSLGAGQLLELRTAAAVHHDKPLLRAGIQPGTLYLRDLGFYDHGTFVEIDAACAFFVSRLKYQAKPIITDVRLGLPDGEWLGEMLHGDIAYGPVVDVDARFNVRGQKDGHVFRVVKIDVPLTDRHDRPTGKTRECWYVTNLARDTWPPASIVAVYRLRWALERLWRSSKHLARLDHLDTARLTVLYMFIAATLIFQLLADRLTRLFEAAYGIGCISRDLVLAVLVTWWRDLVTLLRTRGGRDHPQWIRFRNVLVYDARHPNPSQPRREAKVLAEIGLRATRDAIAA